MDKSKNRTGIGGYVAGLVGALVIPIILGLSFLVFVHIVKIELIPTFLTSAVMLVYVPLTWIICLVLFSRRFLFIKRLAADPSDSVQKRLALEVKRTIPFTLLFFLVYILAGTALSINILQISGAGQTVGYFLILLGIFFLFTLPLLVPGFSTTERVAAGRKMSGVASSVATKTVVFFLFLIVGVLFLLIGANIGIAATSLADSENPTALLLEVNGALSILVLVSSVLNLRQYLKTIGTPVKQLFDQLSRGKNGEIGLFVRRSSWDEIGFLIHQYNEFSASMKTVFSELRQRMDSLTSSGQSLESNSSETAASIVEIDSNIQHFYSHIQSQKQQIDATGKAIDSITQAAGTLHGHIQSQQEILGTANERIDNLILSSTSIVGRTQKAVDQAMSLQAASDAGQESISKIVDLMAEISASSAQLVETNTLISSIAAQTNLLAMNAAIEAAHAGDAGRGFSVVADEIRKLASNAGTQSRSIKENLSKIVNQIKGAVQATETVRNSFQQIQVEVLEVSEIARSIESAAQSQNHESSEVRRSVDLLKDISAQVKEKSSSMEEGSNAIHGTVQALTHISTGIQSGMEEMKTGISTIRVAVDNINQQSSRNKEDIESVYRELAFFKVKES